MTNVRMQDGLLLPVENAIAGEELKDAINDIVSILKKYSWPPVTVMTEIISNSIEVEFKGSD